MNISLGGVLGRAADELKRDRSHLEHPVRELHKHLEELRLASEYDAAVVSRLLREFFELWVP